jgi:hypothetical protein
MQSDMGSVSRTPAAAAASSPAAPDPFSFPVLSSALEDAACAKELASFRLAPIRHPVTDLALTPSSVSTTPPGAVPEMPYAASAALSAVLRTRAASFSTPGAAAGAARPASPVEALPVAAGVQHDSAAPASGSGAVDVPEQGRSRMAPAGASADDRWLIAAGQLPQADRPAGHKVTPPFTVGCVT